MYQINTHNFDCVVIGSGCSGFNSADSLFNLGEKNICIVSEGVNMGTSRNTGSDKQTYYKLSLSSDCSDNVLDMAKTLFSGKSMNGDVAFVESTYSLPSFFKLVELGVEFPKNEYGEYVGYQTDHDVNKRGTSIGPLTSKVMTEVLEKSVRKKNIEIFDNTMIFKLIKKSNKIVGALGLNTKNMAFELFCTKNVIMATGGSACLYKDKVYPYSQSGMSGMAIEVGAKSSNLSEWQYGLASTDFRWNVSGTYQQVIPTYISVDENGAEYEFLTDYFNNPIDAINLVFQKGYQWPFDSKKIKDSSIIDLIAYNEINIKNRAVYLDFRRNPTGFEFDKISTEAYTYLKNSNALLPLPIDRLKKMNSKSIELYKKHNIDLYTDMLKINVCAQHQNGGIAVDCNYESNIKGLYIVGEAAGVFGVYRPGGTALNSTQVSSKRASEHISKKRKNNSDNSDYCMNIAKNFIDKIKIQDEVNTHLEKDKRYFQNKMSRYASFLRNKNEIDLLYDEEKKYLKKLSTMAIKQSDLPRYLKTRDMIITGIQTLSAMKLWCSEIKGRGGAILYNPDKSIFGQEVYDSTSYDDKILITKNYKSCFENVCKIPKTEIWFENIYGRKI